MSRYVEVAADDPDNADRTDTEGIGGHGLTERESGGMPKPVVWMGCRFLNRRKRRKQRWQGGRKPVASVFSG
jgi:hypothetical protein